MTDIEVEPSVIQKEFNAPQQLVFDAWTQVEHLNNWMVPMQGCTCEFVAADIRSGGSSLHTITMPNGHVMWLFTRYEEVSSPEKLVFLQYMSNEQGDILPNPQMPNWPKHMLATLEFKALSQDKTRLTFLWEPRDASVEEISAFEATREAHGKGWGAGLQQLENYLEQTSQPQ